jgi:hypothetical protein
MTNQYELRSTIKKGEGIFTTSAFKAEEIVMQGIIKEILPENDSHASQIDKNTFVRHEGLIPKVNHSCNPNCGVYVNETGGHDLVAIREISVDEEVTFDYAMRNYTVNFFPNCRCGSENCRTKITGWKDLPKEIREKYKGFVAPYLLEL